MVLDAPGRSAVDGELTTTPRVEQAAFLKAFPQDGHAIWDDLIAKRWVELLPGRFDVAVVVAKPQRRVMKLDDPQKRDDDIERVLDVSECILSQVSQEARFGPVQEIREGWLELTPSEANPDRENKKIKTQYKGQTMKNENLTTAIAATAPFDFRLSNQQDQTVLYTRLQQQAMTLELHNTSRYQLTVAARQPASTKSPIEIDWHFQLRFRSGTLWEPGEIKLDEKGKANWLLTHPDASAGETASERPGDIILYLRYISASPLLLYPGNRISISLQNIAVDGRAGSHGTRVELKYQKLQSAVSTKSLSGTCMHYLSVLDESPANEPGTAPILID